MSAIDTDRFRDLLLDHRKQVTDAIEYLHKENPGSITDETDEVTTDNHLADVATVTYDRELDYTLEENSEELLRAIDDALLRINDGTYGICENRGEKISAERLEAVPWTRLCIDCKRLEER
jgi:DnaK suppressor protein